MTAALVCILAVVLDALLGEPRRGHPLTAFGRLAARIEARFNIGADGGPGGVAAGGLVLGLVVGPPVLLALWLALTLAQPWLAALEVLVLWLAVGRRSLADHARAVALPLLAGKLENARHNAGLMVSRDTRLLDDGGVATAATESVLENGSDALFASLFWYLVAGLPGVVLHRLINTLDAMWGYRTPRHERFGRCAARLDDLLNWIPARLTALTYALAGDTVRALHCWRRQARQWPSPNAGPVMAAGAGALGVRLGGPAPYGGHWRPRPELGTGRAPEAADLLRALRLIRRALIVWLAAIFAGGWTWSLITAAG